MRKKKEICKKINEYFKNIHYIYSSLYPKVYSRINQFVIKNKSDFELAFSYYKVQKQTNTNLKQTDFQSFFTGKNPDAYVKREEVNEKEQKPEKTDKWVQKPKPKPKLPTVRGKAKEILDRNLNLKQQKADLKRRLDENTEKMEAIKKAKKNFQKKTFALK